MALLTLDPENYEPSTPFTALKGQTLTTREGDEILILDAKQITSIEKKDIIGPGNGVVSGTGSVTYKVITSGEIITVTLSDFTSLIDFMTLFHAMESGEEELRKISEAKTMAILEKASKS